MTLTIDVKREELVENAFGTGLELVVGAQCGRLVGFTNGIVPDPFIILLLRKSGVPLLPTLTIILSRSPI